MNDLFNKYIIKDITMKDIMIISAMIVIKILRPGAAYNRKR